MTHAICEYYGHDWSKHHVLSGKAPHGYRVDICSECNETRRVWERGVER